MSSSADTALPATQPAVYRSDDRDRGEPLHRKLVWSTLFRLVEVTVLLGVTALWQWRAGRSPHHQASAPGPARATGAGRPT